VFEQWLVYEAADVRVTFAEHARLEKPVRVHGSTVLEPGAPAIWFTFPGRAHDIGRFHLRDGTFTGLYADVLTPVEFVDRLTWKTTDLFLDLWLDRHGGCELLDEDELNAAVSAGWLTTAQELAARSESIRLLAAWTEGTWPPAVVNEWTLKRAQAALAELQAAGTKNR
jgi:uncharacterized protein